MILILSTPTDNDTNIVIDWLTFYNTPFFRLNDEDIMNGSISFHIDIACPEDAYFQTLEKKIFLKEINVVWFRKFGFLLEYDIKVGTNNDLIDYLYAEFRGLSNILMDLLKNKKWLFNRTKMVSKIETLYNAIEVGLVIPKTIITNRKDEILKLETECSLLITKSINEAKYIQYKGSGFTFHTHKVQNINFIEEKFSPSLIQEQIEKEFEIRTFFLDGKCYSMAIFSQSNPKTSLDYRNYDRNKPNRFVPYKLPVEIELKIIKLMRKVKLNTGSIDLIKSKNGVYYFLEVNPSGQFGMVSFPCNYKLHKLVASYLINKNK